MITDINSEDRLVQQTFADHLRDRLGWESVYAYNAETFGPQGTLGRASEREAVLVRDLRAALGHLNPGLPESAREQAVEKLARIDFSRSLVQHNREYYGFIRGGVPVEWRDAKGETRHARAQVIDFRNTGRNRFLAVRELKIQGVRVPHYNRRADLVCFVNGLPMVFIELKAVYRNIRAGFDDNLTDYMSEHSIAQAFHHNAFLVVSNGDQARYGSITSQWEHFVEWKRNAETDKARLDAQALLDGMLAKERLLDLLENFILFDDSRAGGTRKIVARNHQVLGVNSAVGAVVRQEELKRQFPPTERLISYRMPKPEFLLAADAPSADSAYTTAARSDNAKNNELPLVKRAHEDLGRLGVFWHTQGSGKSYSMAFFAEKVRRVVPGNFTFLVMTDREDLDDQIRRTMIGCGITDEKTPRAGSGKELNEILRANHRFVFSLIHKFNQQVVEPYSERDDIIVISDEAHRTQAGRFARNMRLALPNASFIGFTGTPLFKHDELTKRIFGGYISRYDFKRSEEDQFHRQAGLREPGREAGNRPARPERPHRRRRRTGRSRPGSASPAGETARKGLRGDHGRRPSGQTGRGFCGALRHALGDGKIHAGVHRQDHLREDVPAHRAALESQTRPAAREHIGLRRQPLPLPADTDLRERLGAELDALRRTGAVDGEYDHRDRHQRGPERGPRFCEMGI